MADVDASGVIIGKNGFVIPLLRTDLAEGSEEAVDTDVNYTVSSQSAGQYATQSGRGFLAVQSMMTAENQATYAYVLGLGGQIKLALPVAATSAANGPEALPYAKTLVSGDSVRMMSNTSTDRQVALTVATKQGNYAIFQNTPTGSGEVELTHVITGQSIGQSLDGQTLSHVFVSAYGHNNIISGGGAYILNGSGSVVGAASAMDSQLGALSWSRVNIPIGLSFQAVVRTDA